MINKYLIFIFIFFITVINLYADAYNIEFTLKTYSDSNYDITYYQNYKEIVKQTFKDNKLVKTKGKFPDGTLNIVNFNNIPIAILNIKNNKLNGVCTFFQERYEQRSLNQSNYDKIISIYEDGVLNGTTKIIDKFDNIIFELNYKNGVLDGQSIFYDYNVMKKHTTIFDNGTKVSEQIDNFEIIKNEQEK